MLIAAVLGTALAYMSDDMLNLAVPSEARDLESLGQQLDRSGGLEGHPDQRESRRPCISRSGAVIQADD